MNPETGIILMREQPFFSVLLKNTDEGLSEQRVMVRDAGPEKVSSVYPHPLVVGQRISARGTLSLEYKELPEALDRLDRLGSWTSEVLLRAGEQVVASGTSTVMMIGVETLVIGACSYQVWHTENRLDLVDRAPIRSEKFYAPALGVNLKSISLSPAGDPKSVVEFDEIE